MKRGLIAPLVVVALLLAGPVGCSAKVTRDNYDRIADGMTVDEVEDVLGASGDRMSAGIAVGDLELTGEKYEWRSGDARIIVIFKDGRAVAKMWENL